jgi:hypothetical protein
MSELQLDLQCSNVYRFDKPIAELVADRVEGVDDLPSEFAVSKLQCVESQCMGFSGSA